MADEPARPLLAFAFGTMHAALLMLALVAFAHDAGALAGLFDDLATLTGLALFGWLWLASCWAARGALRGVRLGLPLRRMMPDAMGHGMIWGGAAGIAFLLGPLVVALALNLGKAGPTQALGLLFFGVIALAFAGIVGLFVGGASTLLDLALVAAARRLRSDAGDRT